MNTTKITLAYPVKTGDTLWGLAVECYDDGTRWREIYDTNKDGIKELKSLCQGQVLTISIIVNKFCPICGVALDEENAARKETGLLRYDCSGRLWCKDCTQRHDEIDWCDEDSRMHNRSDKKGEVK